MTTARFLSDVKLEGAEPRLVPNRIDHEFDRDVTGLTPEQGLGYSHTDMPVDGLDSQER